MRIALEKELLKFQPDLACCAGMRRTGPKLYRLLSYFILLPVNHLCLAGKMRQDQNGCCNVSAR